ncbi:PPE family protein [Mycobacterium sp.]|uniref:PPE family protein n=1 Tax=Mycobacterium sp. TaxID=1785 RepID=UPI003F9A186D
MSIFDFGALPPEINSGRMYTGAGSGPLVAAASAWDGVAAEMSSAARAYQVAIVELTGGQWLGAASVSMAAAAFPYVGWMNTTAVQAEQTANQARSAAAAYEAAFSATVPPPVIAANRALLTALVATNILGQNTAAIAATEADYGEMWAQDADAMYGYAGASAAATTLTPFSTPSQNTDPAGVGAQAAAVGQAASTSAASVQSTLSQLLNTVPNALQGLASGGPAQWLLDLLNSAPVQNFEGLIFATSGYQNVFGAGSFLTSGVAFLVAPFENPSIQSGLVMSAAASPAVAASDVSGMPAGAGSTLVGPVGGADVSAGLGRSASVSGLSLPQAWGTAAPEIRLAARGLPMAGLAALPEAGAAGPSGWLGGMPAIGPIGSIVNAPRNGAGSPNCRVQAQAGGEPSRKERAPGHWRGFDLLATEGQSPLSEREELIALRAGIAELTKERDLLKRSATLLIKEAMQH